MPDSNSPSEAISLPIEQELPLSQADPSKSGEAPFSIREKALSSSFWSLFSYGSGQVIRLMRSLILTRLLFPEAFGLVALTNIFITGAEMFSDIGLRPNIIRSERGEDPVFLNTAWTLKIIRGVLLWLIMCLMAWPISHFYQDERLLLLIPVIGLETLISSFSSTSISVLYRRMQLKTVKLFALSLGIFGTIVTILLAWYYQSVWAIVFGGLIGTTVATILSHFILPGPKNHFAWDKEVARSLFSFGKWIFVSTFFTFLAMQVDRIILGKLLTLEFLGIYSIAIMYSELPKQLVARISREILYPLYSRLNREPGVNTLSKIIKIRWLTIMFCGAFLALLISVGDLFILFIYDERYHAASLYFPFLAFGIWFYVLGQTVSPAILALGKPQYSALGNFLRFAMIGIGFPLAYGMYELKGIVVLMMFVALPQHLAMAYGLKRQGLSVIGQDIKATSLFFMLLGSLLWARIMLGFGNPFAQIFL